jgi:hypothetical protein
MPHYFSKGSSFGLLIAHGNLWLVALAERAGVAFRPIGWFVVDVCNGLSSYTPDCVKV